MNEIQMGVITLIKSAITGEKLPLPDSFTIEEALPILKKHGIQTMGYLGAANCGISQKDPVMQTLFQDYCLAAVVSQRQLNKIRQLFTAFDENNVDYMPLKGTILKHLYPNPELRSMADADILIRIDQYDRIKSIMESLGYTAGQESEHELPWHSAQLYVELHKYLLSNYNNTIFNYYEDCWQFANIQVGTRYQMSPEDQFVFLFLHFVKHVQSGGIGCRHVADLWVFRRHYPKIDDSYICQEIDKLHLMEFYRNMMTLLGCWFDGLAWDEKTVILSDFIFNSGIWGGQRAHDLASNARFVGKIGHVGKGKWRHFFSRVFPGLTYTGYQYPILKKFPVLLPAIWIIRWIKIVLRTPDVMKRRFQMLKSSNDNDVSTWLKYMEYIGLGYSEDS